MNRRKMPVVRESVTHRFSIAGHDGYVTAGKFEDGTLGEIFILMAKEGSTLSGLLDCFAISVSMGLQHGVPLGEFIDKFCHVRFEPSGITGNSEIPIAKSIIDYIFRWLATQFLDKEEKQSIGIIQIPRSDVKEIEDNKDSGTNSNIDILEEEEITFTRSTQTYIPKTQEEITDYIVPTTTASSFNITFKNTEDAPTCPECGAIMQRSGSCYLCPQCGRTSGCS